jgi:hypothetical protein
MAPAVRRPAASDCDGLVVDAAGRRRKVVGVEATVSVAREQRAAPQSL